MVVLKYVKLIFVFLSLSLNAEVSNDLFFKLEDFSLPDPSYKMHSLESQINSKLVVYYSYGVGCPITRKNISSIEEIVKKYHKNDVSFFFLDSFRQDSREVLTKEISEFKIPATVLMDQNQEIARMLKINRTGEAIVVDTSDFKIKFRGPIDDKNQYLTDKSVSSKGYLDSAISNLLNGKNAKEKYVKSLGCAISIEPRLNVNYYRNVKNIIDSKCMGCHLKQGNPPNNFFNYQDLKRWSAMVKEVIRKDIMPPWEVDPEIKVKNQLMLTPSEKEILFSWFETGMIEGEATYFKKKKSYDEESLTYKPEINRDFSSIYLMKDKLEIPANGSKSWHYELIESGAKSEYFINSLVLNSKLTSNNIIQHAELIVSKEKIENIYLLNKEFLPKKIGEKIYSIIPLSNKNRAIILNSKQLAFRIPKNSWIYLQLHFAKTGKKELVSTQLLGKKYSTRGNLREYFWDKRGRSYDINIPKNTANYTKQVKIKYDKDIVIHAMGPHMHKRGKHSTVHLIDPKGVKKLIFNGRYIFKNRKVYIFEKPIFVKAGSSMLIEFEYDNSLGNPAKIDAEKNVLWGEDADIGEMMLMHIFYKFHNLKDEVDFAKRNEIVDF